MVVSGVALEEYKRKMRFASFSSYLSAVAGSSKAGRLHYLMSPLYLLFLVLAGSAFGAFWVSGREPVWIFVLSVARFLSVCWWCF